MESGLENRVVLVTGASGGIGSVMVRAFLAEGSKVAVHYRNQRDSAEKLATESPGRASAFQADLTQEAEVERLFGDIESELGPVECVIANAGIWPAENVPIHEMTLTQWNKTLAVDLTSVFLTMRRFFIGIKNFGLKDPSAVLIGSTAAVFGEAGHVDYAAAKAGISYGMLQTLKNEISQLARSGRVNAVCPGWVMTPMAQKFAEDRESKARALQTIPMQKFGQPEDIAASAVFLSSPRLSGHLTGQRLVASGGMEGRVLYPPGGCDNL